MKKTLLLPFAFIAIFIFIVSAACNLPFGGEKTSTDEPQVIVVTATPEKVNLPAATEAPVATEAPMIEYTEEPSVSDEPPAYYLEEFDGDLSNFTYDVLNYGSGSSNDVEIEAINGALKLKNNNEDLYTYIYYDPYNYTDVRIDIEAENLATNDNSVQLVCRYNPDIGWYEYNIDNDGEWKLWYYDAVVAKKYIQLYDGGSTAIKMGRDTNTYTMICYGQELSLYINGVFTHTFEHKDLKEGQIGFGISSYDSYPVMININWLEISEP
jgi:hypothetical protein